MNEHVLYLSRMIPKEGFRAYIYNSNNDKKLVNSWDEFQSQLKTGLWFDTIQKPQEKVIKKKGKG